MKKMGQKVLLVAALACVGGPALAEEAATKDFEYHGYMRSGIGASRGGTDQSCFSAPGSSAKFRLGNECETYIEASFVNNHALDKSPGGPSFSTNLNLALVTNGRHDWEPTTTKVTGKDKKSGDPTLDQELTLSLREAFVQAKGVIGSARPWVGKRFYRRQDIHILDYYLVNNSGPGVGIEDIDAGIGKLHLAITRNSDSNNGDTPAQTNTDVRLSDIALGTGKLETILIYGATGARGHKTGEKAYESASGQQIGLIHGWDTGAGFNRVTLQYGRGLFGGAGETRANTLGNFGGDASLAIEKGDSDALDARKKSTTTRLVEELTSQFGSSIANSFVVLYQTTDFGGLKDENGDDSPKKDELMAGFRPVFSLSKHTAVAVEYGLVTVKNAYLDGTEYKDSSLNKFTVAPQITASEGFWARPQLRLFATYASWDSDSKGKIGGPVYAGETKGFSTGAQLEAWW